MAQRRLDRAIVALKEEHKHFIRDGIDDREETDITHRFFLRLFLRVQVKAYTVWIVYRDGLRYNNKPFEPGPHILWRRPFSRWQVHRINKLIVSLPFLVEGRVKGPALPEGNKGPSNDLACNIQAKLDIACQITNFETFLQYDTPIKFFYSIANNIVNETLGTLDYDQFGEWTSELRDALEYRLQHGRDDTDLLIGLVVIKVTISLVVHDNQHDQEMLRMFQLVEQGKRELHAASTAKEQGDRLKLAPSILALRDHEIGRQLIERDAELRKLMIAAGIYPGVQQPVVPDPSQTGNLFQPGYIQPPGPSPQPVLPYHSSGNLQPTPSSPGNISPQVRVLPDEVTQPVFPSNPGPNQSTKPAKSPFTAQRKDAEIEQLSLAGFKNGSWGSQVASYDANGQPSNVEWTLDVYVPRGASYLILQFRCTQEYPLEAPRVWVRLPTGGGFQQTEPNTIATWHPGRMLVEVVREIIDNIPE